MNPILYQGGTILTLDTPLYADALLAEDGVIRAVGAAEDVRALAPRDTQYVDLQGRTLMPAFIDSHSHITALASTMGACSLQGAAGFEEIISRLRESIRQSPPAPGEWITAFGYDQNNLKEDAHPTRHTLDEVSAEIPILISHASGHMGVANTAALREKGITANTPDPSGGVIGREGNGDPNGYLEENAFLSIGASIPPVSKGQRLRQLEKAQQVYLRHGIATIQDGLAKADGMQLLYELAGQGKLKADVVCYADLKENHGLTDEYPQIVQQYWNRLKIGGYKIFLDGSPQGRTAWMSEPYDGTDDYRGYPIYEDSAVEAFMHTALRERMQLLAHCNGDAAAQQMIRCYAAARSQMPGAPDIRPVMIHAQLVRRDQLAEMARLSIIASFFVAHTYYWGDTHLKNFGMQRAARISPANSAQKAGVRYTFHQDTPVIPPDMIETAACAVRRVTKGGVKLSPSEAVSPLQALRAVTHNAAYQYFEENEKGLIRPGMRADFVILSGSPLEMPVEQWKGITVQATVKDGETVYERT